MYANDKVRNQANKFIAKLREDNDGRLPSYAWPGGYQIIYLTHGCDVICPTCANGDYGSEFDDPIVGYDIYQEGPIIQCANCNGDIESDYGDPNDDDGE